MFSCMLKRGILGQSAGIGRPSWVSYCHQFHEPEQEEVEDAMKWMIIREGGK